MKLKSPLPRWGSMPHHLGNAQRNLDDSCCWGVLGRVWGNCLRRKRKGKLTCASHDSAETAARRLLKKIATEIRLWNIDL